ncbi:cysteine hydrolase [Brucella sp. 21LCYQ03]|nr:cysteine hydrolase [Brucella sp. 21LCYQ03]
MSVDVFSAHKAEASFDLRPEKAAVIVVDMINEFCKPGGKMVLPGYEILVPPQLAVIENAREHHIPIFWVHDVHRKNMRREREFLKRSPHSEEGSWGTEIVSELKAREDDIHITKRRYSSFYQTDIHLALKDMLIEQVIVFGVVTNICVRSTVADAFFEGYEVLVPQDCCAATGAREQASSLYDIATHFGVVCNSSDIVSALRSGKHIENIIND